VVVWRPGVLARPPERLPPQALVLAVLFAHAGRLRCCRLRFCAAAAAPPAASQAQSLRLGAEQLPRPAEQPLERAAARRRGGAAGALARQLPKAVLLRLEPRRQQRVAFPGL
jgi:hypothetical protein